MLSLAAGCGRKETRPANPGASASRSPAPDSTPIIDGKLERRLLERRADVRQFHAGRTVEGAAPSQRHEVACFTTRNNLFVGVRCFD